MPAGPQPITRATINNHSVIKWFTALFDDLGYMSGIYQCVGFRAGGKNQVTVARGLEAAALHIINNKTALGGVNIYPAKRKHGVFGCPSVLRE